jgi:hypothetical protein
VWGLGQSPKVFQGTSIYVIMVPSTRVSTLKLAGFKLLEAGFKGLAQDATEVPRRGDFFGAHILLLLLIVVALIARYFPS